MSAHTTEPGRERWASVSGAAASILMEEIRSHGVTRQTIEARANKLRLASRPGLAASVIAGWNQLWDAAIEWRTEAASVIGSSEVASSELGSPSTVERVEVTTREAAEMLGRGQRWVIELINRGALSSRKVGRSHLIPMADVVAIRDQRPAA